MIGLCVGSKDLDRNPVAGAGGYGGADPQVLVSYITQIRAALKGTVLADVPIGHSDKLAAWVNKSNSAVVLAVDWLGIDLQPYLDSADSINNDFTNFQNEYDAVSAISNGKPVWVTETGWPTSGNLGQAVGSPSNAKQYWDDVGCGLFGKTNTWWYNLYADITSTPDWGVVYTNSTTLYDLSCDGVTPKLALNSSQVNEAVISPNFASQPLPTLPGVYGSFGSTLSSTSPSSNIPCA